MYQSSISNEGHDEDQNFITNEGHGEEQNALHTEEGEIVDNVNRFPTEGEHTYQDDAVIESLQENIRKYQDLEVSFLENERSLSHRILELEDREKRLERDIDFYRRRSRSRSRERHYRYRHEDRSHYRNSRSPSHYRHHARHHRASSSPSHQQYRNSTSQDIRHDYRNSPSRANRRPHSSSRSSERTHRPSKRLRRDSNQRFSHLDADNSSNFDRSDFDDSEYNSDLGRSRNSYERRISPSPVIEGPSFPFKGETYIVFDKDIHHHVDNQPHQIIWLGEKITVKWFQGDKKAFCQVNKEDSSSSPYGSKSSANKFLRDILDLTPSAESPGFKRSAFATHFDPNSGLGLAINIAAQSEEALIHHLISGDRKKAMGSFKESAFDSPSTTIFSSGWPKGNHYFKWANGVKLDLVKSAVQLNLDKVDDKKKKDLNILLEKELDTRTNLVNQITGLRNLEIFSDKFKKDDNNCYTTLAIAKGFLPVLKFLFVDWMEAKMALRKSILHDQDTEAVRILLQADMWQPTIFTEESLEEVKNCKDSGLRKILNLNRDGSFKRPFVPPKGNSNTVSRGRSQHKSNYRRYNDRTNLDIFNRIAYDQKFPDPRKTQAEKTNSNAYFVKADNSKDAHKDSNQRGRNPQRGRFRGKNK